MTLLPSPSHLGLPDSFDRWYPGQEDAMLWVLDRLFEPKPRFLALAAPTGAGKSAIAALSGLLYNQRSVILTATKALQTQYQSQLGADLGLADLRGANAYQCTLDPSVDAAAGMCRVGLGCNIPHCPHKQAVSRALSSSLVLTNYACWLYNASQLSGEKNPVQLLVLDEAHQAYNQLSEFCSLEFANTVVEEYGLEVPGEPLVVASWVAWAKRHLPSLTTRVKSMSLAIKTSKVRSPAEVKKLIKMRSFRDRLEAASTLAGDWVVGQYTPPWTLHQRGRRVIYKLCPVWPSAYAEESLFVAVPKVILMSATMTPKTLGLLGLTPRDYDFLELPSSFPVENRLVVSIPGVKMSREPSIEDRLAWVSRIDQIIGGRLDRKGLIHTTSYTRRNFLMDHSRFQHLMISHETGNAQSQILKFKNADPPAVMVSPSQTEGVSYEDEECRYIIISKVPFLDTRDPLTRARSDADKEWAMYETMQTLVQSAGRGNRSPEDICECVSPETLILTDDLRWVKAGSLEMGDRLLGFDEAIGTSTRSCKRKLAWSHVVKSIISPMPRIRLVTDMGEVVCTPNHAWLTYSNKKNGHNDRTQAWIRTDELRIGGRLFKFFDPWQIPDSYEAGYLGGISQNENDALLAVYDLLPRLGFRHTDWMIEREEGVRHHVLKLLGGMPEVLRFLGTVRPKRLLAKYLSGPRVEQLRRIGLATILDIQHLSVGPIVSLQTSSATYFAGGFGAHNTIIIDDDFRNWFYKHNKKFAPGYFQEAVRFEDLLPPPPPL